MSRAHSCGCPPRLHARSAANIDSNRTSQSISKTVRSRGRRLVHLWLNLKFACPLWRWISRRPPIALLGAAPFTETVKWLATAPRLSQELPFVTDHPLPHGGGRPPCYGSRHLAL